MYKNITNFSQLILVRSKSEIRTIVRYQIEKPIIWDNVYRAHYNYQIYPICNYVTDTRSGHPRPHKTRLLIVIFALFGTSSALIARGDRQFTRRLRESFALCH